jgi:hypothetical protein
MTLTRRQFAWLFAGGAACLGSPSFAASDDDMPPNVFISPSGKPYRAADSAAYPVATWFAEADKNADGKLDHSEFLADAESFFKVLDRRGAGVLDNLDIQVYEYRIAPEVLGYRVEVDNSALLWRRGDGIKAKLWLAQKASDMYVSPAPPQNQDEEKSKPLDESGAGASPYSFFPEPEPVTAADFDASGEISMANFLKLADMHFTTLDTHNAGFLTLAGLPKTSVQKQLEHRSRHRS